MEEAGGLQSTGSQRVRHDWATSLFSFLSLSLLVHQSLHISLVIARMITSGSEFGTFSCSFPRARRLYPVFLSWVWWIFTGALSAADCDGVRRDRREQTEFCSPLAVIIVFSPQSSLRVSAGICGEKSGKKVHTCSVPVAATGTTLSTSLHAASPVSLLL